MGVPVLGDLEGVGPVGRDGGVVPFELQVALDDLRHNAFVVHDENSSRHDVAAPGPWLRRRLLSSVYSTLRV